jgi:hypothetical protein
MREELNIRLILALSLMALLCLMVAIGLGRCTDFEVEYKKALDFELRVREECNFVGYHRRNLYTWDEIYACPNKIEKGN